MKRLIRMLTVNALMCLAVACSATAQSTPDNPATLPEQAKIATAQVHVPITLASESNTVHLIGEVNSPVSFLDEDPNGMLSALSDMLNEGAAKKAGNNLESVRRNAMFNPEESMASQFLSANSVKQSV